MQAPAVAFRKLFQRRNRKLYVYLLFLYILTLYYFLSLPIAAGDTDLWYHLAGGRYFFDQKEVLNNSAFSFISPPRERANYYWLFQVMVYKIYTFFDYYGLIFLRAMVFLGIISLVLYYLLHNGKNNIPPLYIALLFLLYLLVLINRNLLVRPHLFTYLFTIAFICIIELKPKKAIFLPLLAILWVNLHGIEYPVMILICLSYIIEAFVIRIKERKPFTKEKLIFIVLLVMSMGAIFLNPSGVELLEMPFRSTEYASQYIRELLTIKLTDYFSYVITYLTPSYLTVFNILLLLSIIATALTLYQKKIRISHLLMIGGGAFLLTKGLRFINEYVLLALPVLKSNLLVYHYRGQRISKPLYLFIVVIMIIMPIVYMRTTFYTDLKYPVSQKNLPSGNVAFLNYIDKGGTVLNFPNKGGYLLWKLYPKYKIFMDMEVPFLFTDEDFFIVDNAFNDAAVLDKVIAKYNPSFIMVPLNYPTFKRLIKSHSEYVVVFFDDEEVLYVNKTVYPDIAEKFALKKIDPFTLIGKNIALLNEKESEAFMSELFRINKIYPDNGLINQTIAMFLNKKGQYEQAIPYAETIIKNFPELPKGYRLKGDSLLGLKQYEQAVSYYELALKHSDTEAKKSLYKKLWFCFSRLEQYNKAYKALKKAVDIYSPTTPFTDFYNLGLAALQNGKITEALTLFRFAYIKTPSDDVEWKKKIEKQLSNFIITDEKLKNTPLLE